jgi:hypothetical protein
VSHRPINQKKLNNLRRALRPALPVYFDLVEWLKMRRYAQTTGEANRLILAGRVRNGSHRIGVKEVPVEQADGTLKTIEVVHRVQPGKYRDGLIVVGAS